MSTSASSPLSAICRISAIVSSATRKPSGAKRAMNREEHPENARKEERREKKMRRDHHGLHKKKNRQTTHQNLER